MPADIRRSGDAQRPSRGYNPSVNNGTRIITSAGLADCICSAPISRPNKLHDTIFSPCKTQVELLWSNSDQNGGMSAKTSRMGRTDFAASISLS